MSLLGLQLLTSKRMKRLVVNFPQGIDGFEGTMMKACRKKTCFVRVWRCAAWLMAQCNPRRFVNLHAHSRINLVAIDSE